MRTKAMPRKRAYDMMPKRLRLGPALSDVQGPERFYYRVTGQGRLRGEELVIVEGVYAESGDAATRAVEDAAHHNGRVWDAEFVAELTQPAVAGPLHYILGGRKSTGNPPKPCIIGETCSCEECAGSCHDESGAACEDCVCGASGCCEWCSVCLEVHR